MIVLASTSPRRIELMKQLGIDFKSVKPVSDEVLMDTLSPHRQVQQLAFNKAISIKTDDEDIVISGDTVVVYKNEILGKPKSKEHALEILGHLNGDTHAVLTSICVMNQNKTMIKTFESRVTLKNVLISDLEEYIERHQPLDKAGAYGIQDSYFNENILNSYTGYLNTIIGFPIEEVETVLKEEFDV